VSTLEANGIFVKNTLRLKICEKKLTSHAVILAALLLIARHSIVVLEFQRERSGSLMVEAFVVAT